MVCLVEQDTKCLVIDPGYSCKLVYRVSHSFIPGPGWDGSYCWRDHWLVDPGGAMVGPELRSSLVCLVDCDQHRWLDDRHGIAARFNFNRRYGRSCYRVCLGVVIAASQTTGTRR